MLYLSAEICKKELAEPLNSYAREERWLK